MGFSEEGTDFADGPLLLPQQAVKEANIMPDNIISMALFDILLRMIYRTPIIWLQVLGLIKSLSPPDRLF
ncbi:hypothetical protein J42TS3_11700 [Paenibacillus vini]|uniref:Uncharacterized protein n=1 Tax=Paenibacillus vini TaxID=1476024 RepID=A0ABQ4M9R0_9BACL|nr:hypothetical protein J42TS3_11700 [Paenibacillus vini]